MYNKNIRFFHFYNMIKIKMLYRKQNSQANFEDN